MLLASIRPGLLVQRLSDILRPVRGCLAKWFDPGPEPDPEWEFFIGHPLQAAKELRERLAIDEGMYLHAHGQVVGDPRAYVLYTALDEVMKTSLWFIRMRELLQGEVSDPRAGVIERLLHTHLQEEQNARSRRLLEVLITLVNCSATNEQEYFRHLLALELLDSELASKKDLEEFWNCPSENLKSSIKRQLQLISEIEQKVDLAKCWYLRERKPISKQGKLRPGFVLEGARRRLLSAFPSMTNNERMLFGFSYAASYGHASESIHYSPDQMDWRMSVEDDLSGKAYLGMLCLAIIARCDQLIGKVDVDHVRKLISVFERSEENPIFELATRRPRIKAGDFVLAYGYLGEVLEIRESRYGYQSFRVKYIAERPLPDVAEDWFTAMRMQLFYTRQQFFDHMRTMIDQGKLPTDVLDGMKQLKNEELQKILAASLTDVWKLGLGAWVREDQRRRGEQARAEREEARRKLRREGL